MAPTLGMSRPNRLPASSCGAARTDARWVRAEAVRHADWRYAEPSALFLHIGGEPLGVDT
jgi:hypothetical protein